MKQKKLFSIKLYIEGLRQLRVLGMLGLIINALIGIIIPMGYYLSTEEEYNALNSFSKLNCVITETHCYFFLFVFVFSPLMVLSLFHFLNKREDCDFYHSIPQTRGCLYVSYSAAMVTWLLIQILIVSIISAICYCAASKYLIIDIPGIFFFAGNIFVASLLVSFALMLACSLCGNMISAIIVFIIIICTPRIFLTVYKEIISSAVPYLTNSILHIFDYKYNLLISLLTYFESYNQEHYRCITFTGSTVYTLVIALIFYFVGLFAFKKRKSETAGMSMNNNLLQCCFRSLFTMCICLIPICLIFQIYTDHHNYADVNELTIFYIVIAYIAAIAGMFIYELLTTRKIRNALKSFRSLPIIAVLNIACLLCLFGATNHYSKIRLDAEDVSSISIVANEQYYYSSADYFNSFIYNHNFEDSQIVSFFCDVFNDYADYCEKFYTEDSYEYFGDGYNAVQYYTVKYNGKQNYTFSIQMNEDDYNTFISFLSDNSEIQNTYMTLPKLTDYDSIYLYSEFNEESSQKQAINVYNSLREELLSGEIDFSSWYHLIQDSDSGYYDASTAIATLDVTLYIKGQYCYLNLPITEVTPRTYQKYIDMCKENHKNDAETVLETYQMLDDYNNYSCYITINAEINSYIEQYYDESNKEKLDIIIPLIKPIDDYDSEEDFLINLYFALEDNKLHDTYKDCLVCISKEDFSSIKSILMYN
ncbi:MAG: hypothetical protein SPF70_12650 [Lachnospiraceae bacterium]|nr:hypothetical protein [Lachnospiraceae bacterium]